MKNKLKFVISGEWQAFSECGVKRYASNITKELDNILDENSVPFDIEIIIPKNTLKIEKYKNIKIKKIGHRCENTKNIFSKINNYFYRYVLLPTKVRKDDVLVDFLPHFSKRADIATIHDCILEFETKEENKKTPHYTKKHISSVKALINKDKSRFITVSNTSKKDIINLYGIKEDKITVISNAWQHMNNIESDERILDKYSLKKKSYCLSIGYDREYKNLKWIQEFAKYNDNELFVITGNDIFDNKPNNIIFLGRTTDQELKSLMANCKYFIFPSRYEGFGIPPLEAMSVGAKCIVSNASCLPEIYEKSVYYLNPENAVITLKELTKGKIEDNKKILDKYSWKKSASLLLKLFYEYNNTYGREQES